MANKKHCDICDKVIEKAEPGGVITRTGLLNKLSDDMELCGTHYSEFNSLVRDWIFNVRK